MAITLPVVGSDRNTWGTKLNTALTEIVDMIADYIPQTAAVGWQDFSDTTYIVGDYDGATVKWTATLSSLIPATATGTWSITVTATALAKRSVADGGWYVFVGSGGDQRGATIMRYTDMTNQMTATVVGAQPDAIGATPIDVRFGGWDTAGTTSLSLHGVVVTAVRVG